MQVGAGELGLSAKGWAGVAAGVTPLPAVFTLAVHLFGFPKRRQEGHFRKSHLENAGWVEKDLVLVCLSGSTGSTGMRTQ